jgi:hypothetical protein
MKLRDINNKALYQHGGPNHFLRAALSHWEAQRDEAVATLELYFNGSVGIGEHSEILAEINKWTDKLSQADENIASLQGYFTTGGSMVSVIQDTEPETEVEEKELLKGNE